MKFATRGSPKAYLEKKNGGVYLISDMAIKRIQYPERKRASCPMIENCSVPRNSYRLFDGSWRMVRVASPA